MQKIICMHLTEVSSALRRFTADIPAFIHLIKYLLYTYYAHPDIIMCYGNSSVNWSKNPCPYRKKLPLNFPGYFTMTCLEDKSFVVWTVNLLKGTGVLSSCPVMLHVQLHINLMPELHVSYQSLILVFALAQT